ncbi:hypothetical protein Val02_66210 [Virgisporangium aliadipatigenens]|uniref:Uncharacterized protein n=1 Tax=Virgisporangium aliadipatigenens TaxID=741659 RepID=A0A8J4DSY5_9ACTN|nr:hypothetical protein [Virgisporangium aliadipatigenens]GIJ49735.1 hypothetical protein Val02_66210 [Virgisporangium aliadipatigenens]
MAESPPDRLTDAERHLFALAADAAGNRAKSLDFDATEGWEAVQRRGVSNRRRGELRKVALDVRRSFHLVPFGLSAAIVWAAFLYQANPPFGFLGGLVLVGAVVFMAFMGYAHLRRSNAASLMAAATALLMIVGGFAAIASKSENGIPSDSGRAGPVEAVPAPSEPSAMPGPWRTDGGVSLLSLTKITGIARQGPVSIAGRSFSDGVTIPCGSSAAGYNNVLWNVEHYKRFSAIVGIPSELPGGVALSIAFMDQAGRLLDSYDLSAGETKIVSIAVYDYLQISCQPVSNSPNGYIPVSAAIGAPELFES